MTDLPREEPEDSVAGQLVRELGMAPALTSKDQAVKALVEEARAETDEIVERVEDEKKND